ncbi:MAG TPA: DUF819 family protein [Gemmatimonadaceae bacterium]|nr:DUF819 family protein [Gemmatimonadaceae bacterium]
MILIGILALLIAASEWLVRHTPLRHAGTALIVILLTAVVANVGIIPSGSDDAAPVPVYDAIFAHVAPIGLFWLLLQVRVATIVRAGPAMLTLFLIGAAGTTVGVLVASSAVSLAEGVGPLHHAVGGMFAGTYIGGSVNFNAVALHYDVVRQGILYGGTIVVDNIITTLWMVVTIALPRLLAPVWRIARTGEAPAAAAPLLGIEEDTEPVHPMDLSLIVALGIGAHLLSLRWAAWLAGEGVALPPILLLTVIALVLAQLPVVHRLRGTRLLGLLAVYLFLAVIGAFADLGRLGELGSLGVTLLTFAAIIVVVHGLLVFTSAWLLRLDLSTAAVASQANVGGGTSALALARSLGREDLILPGILMGSLGNALGTFAGFLVARQLG